MTLRTMVKHAASVPRSLVGWRSLLACYGRGFAQPCERWSMAQRLPVCGASLALAAWLAVWLGSAVDASGSEARRQALAVLEQNVREAQQLADGVAALRTRARALGAGDTPEAVPDNSALLNMVSGAVEKSGVALDLFEPGAANRVAGAEGGAVVDEQTLHVRAVGTYAHLVGFVEALAALPQPVLPSEARLSRHERDQVLLDAMVRVIGEPLKNRALSAEMAAVLPQTPSAMQDPFGLGGAPVPTAGIGAEARGSLAHQAPLGHFQMGMRRALLLQRDGAWALLPQGQP